jgi:hypothetical protein
MTEAGLGLMKSESPGGLQKTAHLAGRANRGFGPHQSPHFDMVAMAGKILVLATASANFSISGASRYSGMFGMSS